MEARRTEYSGERIEEIFDNMNNLKGGEDLELLNQILAINIVY